MQLTIKSAIDRAKTKIGADKIYEIKLLMAAILGIEPKQLLFNYNQPISLFHRFRFYYGLRRFMRGEPVSKITGKKYFYNYEFFTNKNVLDPRFDSETMIDAIAENFGARSRKFKILDLGAGSGCLLITLLKEYYNSYGVGIERSRCAYKVAWKNSKKLGVTDRIELVNISWDNYYSDSKFDIIISNPPYISKKQYETLDKSVKLFDPRAALVAQEDGLAAYKEIASVIKRNLKKSGRAYVEIGKGQEKEVEKIFELHHLKLVKPFKDLGKIVRILEFKLS